MGSEGQTDLSSRDLVSSQAAEIGLRNKHEQQDSVFSQDRNIPRKYLNCRESFLAGDSCSAVSFHDHKCQNDLGSHDGGQDNFPPPFSQGP